MKRVILICIVLSMFALPGVSYAGVGTILFADQDIPVGYCYLYRDSSNFFNGDFEYGSSFWTEWNSPGVWTTDIFSHDYASGSSIYIPSPYPYEGSNTHSQGVGTNNVHGGIYQVVRVIPGITYNVSGVWSGGVGAFGGNTDLSWFEITVYDGEATVAQIDAAPGPNDVIIAKKEWSSSFPGEIFTFGWEEFEGTFTAQSNYITLALKTGKVGDYSAIAAYHDDIKIEATELCVECELVDSIFDSIEPADNIWCGVQGKIDAGVETAPGMVNNIPQTKKHNPIPGQFEIKVPFVYDGDGIDNFDECPRTLERTCIDTASICTSGEGPIAVAVHAGVYNDLTEETAWLKECLQYVPEPPLYCAEWGTDFAGKNWATYAHVPCYTGLQGICGPGWLECEEDEVVCKSVQEPQAENENCDDGLDNDCDGLTDGDDVDDCGVLCPCFDVTDVMGTGIDYDAQVLPDAACLDLLPDAIQLRGSRDGSGSGDFDPQAWIANAVFAPILPANQCFFKDNANGIDNGTGGITDEEVAACLEILLNSQMFSLNNCPAPPP